MEDETERERVIDVRLLEIRDSRNERRERNSTSNVTSMETQLLSFLPPLPTLHLVSGLFPNELGTVDDDRKMRFSARIMRVPSRDVNMNCVGSVTSQQTPPPAAFPFFRYFPSL